MSEMVERVARAIYAREKLRSESMERIANQGSEGPWVSLLLPYESQNEIYRDLARGAIAAMREPTEAMRAAADALEDQPGRDKGDREDGEAHWRAMIGEVLK